MVKITPLLQAQWMEQLSVIRGFQNGERFYSAWRALNVFVGMCPDAIKDTMKPKLSEVQYQIDEITADKQQDLIQQRTTQNYRVNRLCRRIVPGLVEDVMSEMFKGGYFEFGRKEEGGFA